ncbi:helix-turn-helix domain-containing protein [Gordonia sp. CPCC 205333]|uniref:helix-turn-helix domain-containing protein n=1 Tax=Gordonia sp. CPCC 205333 TaxID=3140790 RepID=UPI003AF3AA02
MPERIRGSLEWDTYAESFGRRLRCVREIRGLSQEELGFAADVSRNQISNLERATSSRTPKIADPGMSMVYRLARALEIPPTFLMPDGAVVLGTRSGEWRQWSRVEVELNAEMARLGVWETR